jgi:hypothetical protein
MPAQGRVLDFLLDLQGNRVVYAADELIDLTSRGTGWCTRPTS